MKYTVHYTENMQRQIKKLDRYTKIIILSWVSKNLEGCENPRVHGKALTKEKNGQWRYRIGDCRLICIIEENRLIITAINIRHQIEV